MVQRAAQAMTSLEWGLLLTLSLLWGGSFFFVGIAVDELPPFTVVVLRVGLAAIALHLVVRARGLHMPRDPKLWGAFLAMGFLNNVVPFSLIVWGQTQIASGLASILNATTPLFGVVVAHFLTSDERLSGGRLVGVLIGFTGVVFMIGPAALGGVGGNVLAQIAVLGAALFYAISGVYGRRFGRMKVSPLITATGQITASTLMLLPLALFVDQPWSLPVPGPETWAAIAGLSLLSTALAYILFFRILATAGATNIMLVTFLIPVSAILLGALVLAEHLDPRHFLGMALIFAGLAAIDGRFWKRLRRPAPSPAGE